MVVEAKVRVLIIGILWIDRLAFEGIAEVTLHESINHLIITLKVRYILKEHSFLLRNSHLVEQERDTATAKASLGANRIGLHHLWIQLRLRAFFENSSSIVEGLRFRAGFETTVSLIRWSRPTTLSLEVETNRLVWLVLPALDDLLLANRN